VTAVNDPPFLLRFLPGIIMSEDTVDSSLNLSDYFIDVDIPYGDRLQFSCLGNGSIAVSVSQHGLVTLRPPENWSGVQNMTMVAADKEEAEARGGLTVVVLNTPDPPTAICATREFTIFEDSSLVLDLSKRFWDADLLYGDFLTYSVEVLPSDFNVRLGERSGALNITPPKDYNGLVTLTFSATDSTGLRASEAVKLTVAPVNDPPVVLGSFPPSRELRIPENSTQVFSVVAMDIDSSRLDYAWLLDGNAAGQGPDFTYSPDFASAGRHNLTAVVSDGEFNIPVTWDLTVTNVNRPPTGVRILSPANGTKVQAGRPIDLGAEGSDPDGDDLTFSWKDNGGRFLGSGKTMRLASLPPGKHAIALEVSDGNSTVTDAVELSVSSPPAVSRVPGPGPLPLLACLAMALILARRRTR
jgi:hypothetical protein